MYWWIFYVLTSSGFSEVIRVAMTCPLGLGQISGLKINFKKNTSKRLSLFRTKGNTILNFSPLFFFTFMAIF